MIMQWRTQDFIEDVGGGNIQFGRKVGASPAPY